MEKHEEIRKHRDKERSSTSRTVRFSRQIEMLAGIASTVGIEGELEKALGSILGLLTERLFSSAALFLVEGEELILQSWRNLPDLIQRRQTILSVGEQSPGQTAQDMRAVILHADDVHTEETKLMKQYGIETRINVPVLFHRRTVGVLSLLSNNKLEYSSDIAMTLSAVASQIGMGIENHRMVVKIQREAGMVQNQKDFTQALIDAVGDAVISLDADERIRFHNSRFFTLTRFSTDDLNGKHWKDFVKTGREAFANVLKESMEKFEPVFCECHWLKKSGDTFAGFTGVCPRRGPDGNLAGYVVSIVDLTERRYLEDLLRRQNEELTFINEVNTVLSRSFELGEVAEDLIEVFLGRLDADFGLIYLEEPDGRQLQARASIGLTDAEMIKVEFATPAIGLAGTAYSDGKIQQHLGNGGTGDTIEGIRPESRLLALPLPVVGENCGVMLIGRNGKNRFTISEIKFCEIVLPQIGVSLTNLLLFERIRLQAAKTRSLAEITSALLEVQEEERFATLAISKTVEAMALDFSVVFNVARNFSVSGIYPNLQPEWIPKFTPRFSQLIDLFDSPEFQWIESVDELPSKEFRAILEGSGAKSCAIIPIVVNGKRRAVLLLAQSLFARRWPEEDRDFIRAIADQLGIAYRNSELYRELKQVNTELLTLDEMKSNLLANVSHELRTPLVSVRGYIEMTLSGILGSISDRQSKGLEVAIRNVDRLVGLIDNLLNFARLDAGREKLHLSRFLLSDLVEATITELEPIFKRNGTNVDADLVKDIELFADRDQLHRLLSNLLDNATKFASTNGKIRISTDVSDIERKVTIAVHDNGPGIPEKEREKVFERFYQVDSASTRKYGGTGIGLSICRDIVLMHGGEINAGKSPLGGAVLTVKLPTPSFLSDRFGTTGQQEEMPKLVLVNSHIGDQSQMLQNALRNAGFNAIGMGGYGAAYEGAMRHNPDVIVSDLFWPDDGCFRLLHAIRAHADEEQMKYVANCFLPIGSGKYYWFDGFHPVPLPLDSLRLLVSEIESGSDVLLINIDDEVENMMQSLSQEKQMNLLFADSDASELPIPSNRFSLVLFDVSRSHHHILSLLGEMLITAKKPLPKLYALSSVAQPLDRDGIFLLKGPESRKIVSEKAIEAALLSLIKEKKAEYNGEQNDQSSEKHLLVIDDEPEILELIALILEPSGWKVSTMTTGMGVSEAAFRLKPQLILLDIAMPGMDGFEVISRLSSHPETAKVPVVIVSARTDAATVRRAKSAGAKYFLHKPFKTTDLLKIIDQIAR